jgi:ribonuclease Z
MRRRGALQVFGPPGLKAMTDHLLAAWAEDIRIRTTGLERERAEDVAVAVHEIGPGVVYDSGGVRVTAIPVQHAEWAHAYGYRVDTPTRSIVISGDTRPSEALVEGARGVDVLIHEVYAASRLAPETRLGGDAWPTYMHASHTSNVELGALAARIRPKLLILTHLIRMGASDDELLAGIRAGGFTGRTVIGRDLDRY